MVNNMEVNKHKNRHTFWFFSANFSAFSALLSIVRVSFDFLYLDSEWKCATILRQLFLSLCLCEECWILKYYKCPIGIRKVIML